MFKNFEVLCAYFLKASAKLHPFFFPTKYFHHFFYAVKHIFFVSDVVYVMYVAYVEAGKGRDFKRLNVA